MSFIEMIIIVASVFGCGLAMMRSTETPWRAPGAAFGCGILTLGIQGTTAHFLSGLSQMSGASRATRDVAFNELVNHAYRPMYVALIGLLLFYLTVRSVPIGDDRNTAADNLLAALMLAGTFAAMGGMAAYHVAFFQFEDPTVPSPWMGITGMVCLGTLGLCVLGGTWAVWQTVREAEPART